MVAADAEACRKKVAADAEVREKEQYMQDIEAAFERQKRREDFRKRFPDYVE